VSFPERLSTILHTHKSPHALDVHFEVYYLLKVKRMSKKVVTCHVVYGVYLEKRSTDFSAVYLFNYYIFDGFYVY
jgi:hypothetical protein